ncbi:MAG: tetratricopeptide repeat protein [Candidatus Acidiferrales bacterium]|jgi:tetratricopeptide (TPR) repeat protein
MKRLALFVIMITFWAALGGAQQISNPPPEGPAGGSAPQTTAPPPMTNRQKEVMRAQILMARKDYAGAVKAYEDLLKDDPKNAEMLNSVGIAYQELGDSPHAEHYYKRALHADKNFASAINNLGALEYSKKHYGKAIKYYKKALAAMGSDHAVVYSNLGFAYYGNKEYPAAMDAFGKALAIDPDIFARKGGAGAIIQQKSAPDPGTLYFLVAKSYGRVGDAERAAHYLKMARDDGYQNFLAAKKDPDFARVIKDPRVQEVFQIQPAYADDGKKSAPN